jgi:tellurite resistance protein TerC
MMPVMGKPVWMWAVLLAMVAGLLTLDLGFFHKRRVDAISVRDSLLTCSCYTALAGMFGLWVWHVIGADAGANFFTGYVIELSLSMDNLFVMAVIFLHLSIPEKYRHRVLMWGITGVILLRGAMILAGVALIGRFDWILLTFGVFLIGTGIRMLFEHGDKATPNFEESRVLAFLKRVVHVTSQVDGDRFFVRDPDYGRELMCYYATPLFLALCLIELSDIVFAVDSIPAIFAVTTDPFIIFSSNLFACLGLRALFFALSAVMERFAYVKYALAIILAFIGAEIFYDHFISDVSPMLTLGITLALLLGGAAISLAKTKR